MYFYSNHFVQFILLVNSYLFLFRSDIDWGSSSELEHLLRFCPSHCKKIETMNNLPSGELLTKTPKKSSLSTYCVHYKLCDEYEDRKYIKAIYYRNSKHQNV